VTIFSTVALEAMICGKPLVAIHYGATPSTLPYGQEYGAAYDVHSGRQLEKAIAEILTDEGTRRRLVEAIGPVLDNELFGLDGRSTERMESEIMELVRERSGDAHKQARSSGSGPVD
jgi:glycosyltransferase involved in cell wall biosynthesis